MASQPCLNCKKTFIITAKDEQFAAKLNVSVSQLCNNCIMQRHYTYRNERALYQRKCDHCHTEVISMFSAQSPFQIFCNKCWWSDQFDPLSYGQDFDFSRPFFEQFRELQKKVPIVSLAIADSENSDYTNYSTSNKNCYLISCSDYNEDCLYSTYLFKCKNAIDCISSNESELIYNCIDAKNCYQSAYLQNCQNCSDSLFCYACRSCQDCIGCVGLRNKQYYILNKPYLKEEYSKYKKELLSSPEKLETFAKEFANFKLQFPHKFAEIENCLESSGDHLNGCKNCENCFDAVNAEDCKNVTLSLKSKDCYQCVGVPNSEICYQAIGAPDDYAIKFSCLIWPKSSFLEYCLFARMSHHSFGCISILRNKYCILNKQYTQAEYEKLLPKIIEHMTKNGEYGQFFPIQLSPFPYNNTLAQDYFPLTKEDVLKQGFQWKDEDTKQYRPQTYQVPGSIQEVKDEITNQILVCQNCGKNYKIIPQELKFYRQLGLPIPRKCLDCRYSDRIKLRNPRRLWPRTCAKCNLALQSSFAPSRSEKIYCEKCYLETVG